MALAGEVHLVPKELSLADDPKDRCHALLHDCHAGDTGSVAYGSKEGTQAVQKNRCVIVEPRADKGFSQRTFLFPALLTPIPAEQLDDPKGRLPPGDRQAVRNILAEALGIGSGRFSDVGQPSWRGILVRFSPALQARLESEENELAITHGFLMSRHDVSLELAAFQTVIPVLPDCIAEHEDELDIEASDVPDAQWLDEFGAASALVLVSDAFHVLREELVLLPTRVIDVGTLARVESTLMARLLRGYDAPAARPVAPSACADRAS